MTASDPRVGEIQAITFEAVNAAILGVHLCGGVSVPKARKYASASLEAAAPHMHAHLLAELRKARGLVADAGSRALEDAADLLKPPGTLWWGDVGVTVADPPGLPFATLDEWLRARAAAVRGEG